MSRRCALRAGSLLLVVPLALTAQGRGGAGGGGRGGAPVDTTYDVSWRNLGPDQSGRMTAVAGSTARPNEYYMGTTGGGVWKTTDGGRTTVPVTDAYFGGTIGSIDVQQSNPDVVWVGGGETPIRGNVSHGDGVWKTTDGGTTWQYMGLKETQYIARVRIHPTDPNTVYVGALGHVFGPNKERGVYRTTDGGRTWKQILFRNDSTGVADLTFDPSNPRILYATFWQVGRKPWLLSSGGNGSGIFKTTDGGDTWTEITRNPGLPQTGPAGRDRHHGVGGEAEPVVGDRGARAGGWRVSLGRCGRDVDVHDGRSQSAAALVVLLQAVRGSEGHQRGVRPECVAAHLA